MLGRDIFGGNLSGPKIFITDDSSAEQLAIKSSCPRSTHFLCTLHVLQAVWRWLIQAKNKIERTDKAKFYKDFRAIMYATNAIDSEEKYRLAIQNAKFYTNYCQYLEKYWARKEK